MSTIGEKILLRRKELGMRQEDLARLMGYKSKSTINKIELGINDIPQSKIVKFAEVLATTPGYLMGWEDEEARFTHSMEAYSIARAALAEPTLTEGEKMWMELYHRLSDETRALLIETMGSFDSLSEDEQKFALRMLRGALRNQ